MVKDLKFKNKIVSILLALALIFSNLTAVTVFADGVEQPGSLVRVQKLGILNEGTADINSLLTRGQLVEGLVAASGLMEKAEGLRGSTVFPDIESGSELSGYINAVIGKGIIYGMPDGYFHPESGVTFAEACTIMVKLLGYVDSDVTGIWPNNYINKASDLELTKDLNLKKNQKINILTAAIMFDRLLGTKVKGDANKTFMDFVGLYPVYSAPEIAVNFNPSDYRMGNITFEDNIQITKDGKLITKADIQDLDVVYRVSDINGGNRSIIVLNNRAEGNIDAFLPNEFAPTSIKIDGTSYGFGKEMDVNKLSDVKVGDKAAAILGYDGKVIDVRKINFKTGNEVTIKVLGNMMTSDNLQSNQVLTDLGIYYVLDNSGVLDLGGKYNVAVDGDTIVKVKERLNLQDNYTIHKVVDSVIWYGEDSTKTMAIPQVSAYYYHGVKQNYNNLSSILKSNMTLIFTYNSDKIGYDYAVIIDPVYSKPEVVVNFNEDSTKLGDIVFDGKTSIIKNGQNISKNDIEDLDVVYNVTDINGRNRNIIVFNNRAEGNIKAFTPNGPSPISIQIENASYTFSKHMNLNKLADFMVGDKVAALLGYDGKVIDLKKIQYKTGVESEIKVLGNSMTIDSLTQNQVMTDLGKYFVADNLIPLEIGRKYKVSIDEDTVVKIKNIESSIEKYSIRGVIDSTVSYGEGSDIKTMNLPKVNAYYYNGTKIDYSTALASLKLSSSLILAKGNGGYEYGVIIDPVYGKPLVVNENSSREIEDLNNKRYLFIYRNGTYIWTFDYLKNRDVVYTVTDIWGGNRYIYILDTKVSGKITSILPNMIDIKTIQIGNTSYNISQYFEVSNFRKEGMGVGANVTLVLDINGKVIDIIK